MIILNKKKLIFIHIPKTAGSAFTRTYLDPLLEEKFTCNNPEFQMFGKRHFNCLQHATWKQFIGWDESKRFRELFDSCTKVTIVRHPVKRLVSAWCTYGHRHYDNPIDFVKLFSKEWPGPNSMYEFIDGASPLMIIKQESLDEDSKTFCNKFNIDYKPTIRFNERKNKKSHLVGREITDKEMIDFEKIIKDLYYKDFQYFGYDINKTIAF